MRPPRSLTATAVTAVVVLASACQLKTTTTTTTTSSTTSSSSSTTSSSSTSTSTSSTAAPTTTAPGSAVDLTKIPLGDGKVGTTAKVGWIDSCQTSFGGGGAFKDGPWIDTANGTWNRTAKVTVDDAGRVGTSSHSWSVATATRVLTTNDLPDHDVGRFPISSTDDAYQYDRNPNTITSQSLTYRVPANPTVAATPSCLNMGAIGVLLTGTVLFNGLDGLGRDAAAHEVQDDCGGHPERTGEYHYHDLTSCLTVPDDANGHSGLVGYALDGFGIYGPHGEGGATLTDADLDECHGHTHAITWDGVTVTMYHYHATAEYPYTLGCYKGTPTR